MIAALAAIYLILENASRNPCNLALRTVEFNQNRDMRLGSAQCDLQREYMPELKINAPQKRRLSQNLACLATWL